jgi:broad specificity polyphosphatase/5'/3'-nucleotidase SurE
LVQLIKLMIVDTSYLRQHRFAQFIPRTDRSSSIRPKSSASTFCFFRADVPDGRNSSAAFALSSGTLGAALAATLSVPIPGPSSASSLHSDHIPCIAISYGVVSRPVPPRALELANEVSADICQRLIDDWGHEDATGRSVQIYSLNVPLVTEQLEEDRRKVCWTNMWRNTYGQLFKRTAE